MQVTELAASVKFLWQMLSTHEMRSATKLNMMSNGIEASVAEVYRPVRGSRCKR